MKASQSPENSPQPAKLPPGQNDVREHLVLGLVVVVLYWAACVGIPLLLGIRFGPWYGAGGALIAVVLWTATVRPMPGFVQGMIALTGLMSLLGALVSWIVLLFSQPGP